MIEGLHGSKEIPLSEFYLGYRKINLGLGELIVGLKFMIPQKISTFKLYKNANRKDMDISAVNLAIKIDWKDEHQREIHDVTIAAGGIAATPLRLKKTEQFIRTNGINAQNLHAAIKELHSEFNPLSDVRATAAYRHVLIENYFKKCFSDAGVLV
jgi:xanthine dehydrogenase small subunit